MTAEQEIKFDRSLLGVEHPVGTFPVTREMMVAFARSTGETSPMYVGDGSGSDDIVAPMTFCNVFTSGVTRPDIKERYALRCSRTWALVSALSEGRYRGPQVDGTIEDAADLTR